MKRFLLSLVLIFFTINTLFAQRDTEHWIAPYYTNPVGGYQNKVYLSTDSTTPFPVQIFSANTLIGTVTIAKGDPQTYNIEDPSLISASGITDAFVIGTKGLYLKAEKPFYCSLRIAQSAHGEIITSKGKAGIGNKFFVAAGPNTRESGASTDNFTAGILATEDNTSVVVTWNTPGLKFINGNPPGQSHSFVLNKGQSFIFAGKTDDAAVNNKGFIGAKIVTSKPVTLTNGNCNGNFTTSPSGSDPILDQSVPVDRLGNTFAMVRSKSDDPTLNMEGGIVIATEDNTEIFINGSTTPIATRNAGQWYRINETSYIAQGGGHSNMFVSTSKNVYLYQFVGTDSDATNGFNYIPPLNCFLPRKIDEIGKINEMPGITTSTIKLKLNIVTEVGASVLVNGVPPTAAQGPYPLTGNSLWVTYSLENFPPNLTITSTKAVTAGINGGYSSAGYGGYFAGFSSVPVIAKKSGDCVPGLVLQVDDTYDTYQWFLNDAAIPGATTYTHSPTQPGYYTVRVTMGACQSLTTPIYKVTNCLKKTIKNEPACSTKIITPTFSSSTQTPVISTIKILSPPSNGTAVLNPDGTITYTPKPNFEGNDIIVYTFCGDSPDFMDCEEVTLNLTVVPFIVKDATIKACWYDVAPYAYFDLTKANVTDYGNAIKKYYRTLKDLTAGINEITATTNYPATGGIVYVKITTEQGCEATAKIELIPLPIKKSPILVDKYICIDAKTDLDAGTGYDSYQWSTGATTSGIRGVGVGEYSVILEKNGCFITQVVRVRKAVDPVIQQIEINNTTATVVVVGGKAPYKYSVDGTTNWQDSNTFTGLTRGQHKFYVKDAYNCTPVSAEVTVPNLLNAITPNGDNINDYIDYSDLAYKDNLSFVIYDRYGNMIFTGNKFNNYKWDGRHFDKKLVTGTYWYHVSWNESNKEKTEIKYTGWIMVKNRE
ncbi:gliding motility-associated C-terminal domain [Chryseobacterium nakagawai]|uniref:Gliding motility-associated C-terminal domain-containing protein n=1 Tax=Chryseobacterium nakagawai TaxID=1241982 RepID=A0AAD0YL75_CHRNA|nr:gliding motility-associated C-terminal domain-containing protein [Chryseobacterium nakagawai]AZA91290.1 gliding motility-associated C-terminal domain-containing protein [Chryseobacterium nakagawai]VEH22859.1 gliding motility-associated C-terminal domain [Chryseobacterium nakagawai]